MKFVASPVLDFFFKNINPCFKKMQLFILLFLFISILISYLDFLVQFLVGVDNCNAFFFSKIYKYLILNFEVIIQFALSFLYSCCFFKVLTRILFGSQKK